MNLTLRHENVGPDGGGHRLRIAHLSDLHLWFGARKLDTIEGLLAPWDADVIALTGDYADTPRGQRLARTWIERQAAARPVCWIAGNHDHWWGAAFVDALLVTGAHAIDYCDAWIATRSGRAYRFTTPARAEETMHPERASAPTVVLAHDPARVLQAPGSADQPRLALAGHLHGGQIMLWRDRQGRSQPAAAFYRGAVDRTAIGTTTLIVSRGLGDTLPVRFRAPHEIVIVDFWS